MDFTDPLPGPLTYLAWNIDPRRRGPFVRPSAARRTAREDLTGLAQRLREVDARAMPIVAQRVPLGSAAAHPRPTRKD